ncbi:MAG TPA: hypothetical protein VGD96_14160 [Bradyrhizobium sp.]
MARSFGKLATYPDFAACLTRMHAQPAFKRSVEKGEAYRLPSYLLVRPLPVSQLIRSFVEVLDQ